MLPRRSADEDANVPPEPKSRPRLAAPRLRALPGQDDRDESALRLALARVLLENSPGAAFVLDEKGEVRLANLSGRRQLAADPEGVRDRLRASSRGENTEYRAAAVDSGTMRWTVLLERPAIAPVQARLRIATQRWSLSVKQVDVLTHLAIGKSNASIAEAIGLKTKTVELHVGAILAAASVANRAALVATFWNLE